MGAGALSPAEGALALRDVVESFLDAGGPLARHLEGYAPRDAQIDMAMEVARCLEEGGRLVIEAGTGTGKSLAYLAAALLSGQQVIVATGTKALQDQLMEKDLPVVLAALKELTGKDKTAALMKGRQNYLCKLRFEHFSQRPRFVFQNDKDAYPALVEWAARTETGDRAEMAELPDFWATWSDLDAASESCIGQRCPQYQECFVTDMRRKAAAADLVVANHHLLCADARVRLEGMPAGSEAPGEEAQNGAPYAQVLPDADALIIDEAHALPDVASDYFGVALSSGQVERLLKDVRGFADSLGGPAERLALLGATQLAEQAILGVFESLGPLAAGPDRVRLHAHSNSDELSASATRAREGLSALTSRLAGLLPDDSDPEIGASFRGSEGKALMRRADQVWAELDFVLGPAREDPRFVAFLEPKKRGLALGAVPVDVASALAKTLFGAPRPVVLTSATLAVQGSTSRFEERVGLAPITAPGAEPVPSAGQVLLSPFDHEHRAALYAPLGMKEPDHDGYFEAFCDEARFLVSLSRGGALLLFTSYRALERAHEALAPLFEAEGLPCLKQGDAPKGRLLESMRAHDGERGAVLFATLSFWEGVDIPGRALRLVLVDRLPFRSPKDPVLMARADLLKSRGHNPFEALTLPEAALLLKQGAGRLLRRHDDAGVVAVLDGRLRSRRYGRVFLDTLPPMTRVGSRKALTSFWTRFVLPPLGLSEGAAA
jgi:ATP-dependent DNA helicase DinG